MSESPKVAQGARLYAAIDIGTVTCRLLVAEVLPDGAVKELCRESVICNLGMGVDETGLLAPDAIERVGAAVDGFMAQLASMERELGGPIPRMAMATSASRDAKNSGDFKARLAQAGLELSIIPGEREAALSFAGASSAFAGERVFVVDIGGGSTEIIAGMSGSTPDRAHSFNVGCRRMTERFFQTDPPTSAELDDAREWVTAEFADYLHDLRAEGLLDGRMVAVAGTATSVVSMREGMEVYDRDRVHGTVVARADVDALYERLSQMTLTQREHVVGLHPGRAPVIVAGMVILQQVMELSGADSFTVSECDILHGIIKAQVS